MDVSNIEQPESSEMEPSAGGARLSERSTDLRTDIDRMLEHCLSRGIPVPEDIQSELKWVYSAHAEKGPEEFVRLVKTHGLLSRLIVPATPQSLAATSFSLRDGAARRTTLFIVGLILVAIIGIIGYLITLREWGSNEPTVPRSDASATAYSRAALAASVSPVPIIAARGAQLRRPSNQELTLRKACNHMFAATVGSAFYALLTAYGYLRKRTFNPDYIPTYVIRLVLGVISGFILATFGSELSQSNDALAKLGPSILALLGGYSAEAVRQILDRVVEVLTTAVQGRDTFNEQRLVVTNDLLSIAQEAAKDKNTPVLVKEKLDALMKKLQQ